MIVVRKYNKNGSSDKVQFNRKLAALLWLSDHMEDAEWCWIMYEKKESEENA